MRWTVGTANCGPGVESARALAGIACPYQIELAGGHDPVDEPDRFGLDAGLVLAVGLPGLLLADQSRQDDSFPGPTFA